MFCLSISYYYESQGNGARHKQAAHDCLTSKLWSTGFFQVWHGGQKVCVVKYYAIDFPLDTEQWFAQRQQDYNRTRWPPKSAHSVLSWSMHIPGREGTGWQESHVSICCVCDRVWENDTTSTTEGGLSFPFSGPWLLTKHIPHQLQTSGQNGERSISHSPTHRHTNSAEVIIPLQVQTGF